jgi:hypothetical protein
MITESLYSAIKKKENGAADSELTEDVLSINCRKCNKVPDFRSPGCMKCIIHHISRHGSAGRIRLRTSRDLELFGPAADALCELAIFYGFTNLSAGKGRGCSDCANSCPKVMDVVWSGFPDPNFDSARGKLASFHPADGGCTACIKRTYRALDQAEHGMNNLKKRISVETARAGGV